MLLLAEMTSKPATGSEPQTSPAQTGAGLHWLHWPCAVPSVCLQSCSPCHRRSPCGRIAPHPTTKNGDPCRCVHCNQESEPGIPIIPQIPPKLVVSIPKLNIGRWLGEDDGLKLSIHGDLALRLQLFMGCPHNGMAPAGTSMSFRFCRKLSCCAMSCW